MASGKRLVKGPETLYRPDTKKAAKPAARRHFSTLQPPDVNFSSTFNPKPSPSRKANVNQCKLFSHFVLNRFCTPEGRNYATFSTLRVDSRYQTISHFVLCPVYGGKEQFEFPKLGEPENCIADILEENVPEKYTLSDKLWSYLQNYAMKHKEKGNGFGFGLVDMNGITRTLSARYYKDGSEILIPQGDGVNPRRLTPRECARLMGYPDEYIINAVSEVQAYRQCGNSVIVPLITAVSEQLVNTMKKRV